MIQINDGGGRCLNIEKFKRKGKRMRSYFNVNVNRNVTVSEGGY